MENIQEYTSTHDNYYKGNMYLKLTKNLPYRLVSLLSDLSKKYFARGKHAFFYEDTPFFKDEVWKYLNVDFGRTFSKDGHTIDIGYNSDVRNQYKDYHFDGYYLFIYFNTFNYYKNAEKLINIVKNYIATDSPNKIGKIVNKGRNYHQNLYVDMFVKRNGD